MNEIRSLRMMVKTKHDLRIIGKEGVIIEGGETLEVEPIEAVYAKYPPASFTGYYEVSNGKHKGVIIGGAHLDFKENK